MRRIGCTAYNYDPPADDLSYPGMRVCGNRVADGWEKTGTSGLLFLTSIIHRLIDPPMEDFASCPLLFGMSTSLVGEL